MIVYIIQFLGGLFTLAGRIFDYLNQRQLVNLAKTAQELSNLKAQVDAAHKAVQIREAAAAAAAADPAGVMSDDDFTRPE